MYVGLAVCSVSYGHVVLDGTSGTYVSLPGNFLAGLSNVTIEAWGPMLFRPRPDQRQRQRMPVIVGVNNQATVITTNATMFFPAAKMSIWLDLK